jgi:hypothetical protein
MASTTYQFTETPYNQATLQIELDAAFGASIADGGIVSRGATAFDVMIDDSVTQQQVQDVVDLHDPNVLSDAQQVEAAALVALGQGKIYLRNQLIKASPNVNTIYTAIKNAVDGNEYLLQMVDNVIAINSNAYVWTLNLVTPTALDKQRYIKCVMEVIALLT